MVNKLELEDQPKQVHHQPSLTVTKSTDPSEEDLSRGVFTEVSFAGTFAPSQKPIVKITPTIQKQERVDPEEIRISSTPDPVPSPRLKRKARKEQMLKEHKEAGREALSMLVKNVQPNKTNSADVNAMLDDLCKHGADVERDIDEGRKLSRLWSQDAARKHKIEVRFIFIHHVCHEELKFVRLGYFPWHRFVETCLKIQLKIFPSIN